jgi:peptidoglycan/LPS O-acetylase OafA/YrhL
LSFPLACTLLKRDRLIVALCVAAVVVGPAYRSLHSDNEIFFMYAYPACFDAIAIGCLAALLQRKFRIGARPGMLIRILAGTGLAICYFAGIEGHETFGFSLVALCAAGLLVNPFEASTQAVTFMPGRILCWFGRHSYELYLFHIILLAGIRDWLPKQALAYAWKLPLFLVFLLLSGLIAAIVARYLADPSNARLRLRLARGV